MRRLDLEYLNWTRDRRTFKKKNCSQGSRIVYQLLHCEVATKAELQIRSMASLAAALLVFAGVLRSSQAASLRRIIPELALQDREFTYPSRVNSDGHHMSFELRELTANNEDRLYFKVEAFGEIIILNVTTNSQFVADDHVVEYVGENGSTLEYPMETGCFHSGHVVRAGGWAAVSTCRGRLNGVIATNSSYYFIEPLESGRSGLPPSPSSGWKHVVYKHRVTPRDVHSCASSAGKAEASTANLRPNADSPKMKRTVVSERFVETAIVADRSMLEHHGREGLQSYLFTLMNVVSHLYRDPTIGHAVNVVLVRTIILNTDKFKVSRNAHMSLINFCTWQKTLNEQGSTHHDIAVLITRKSICETTSNNCGVLGMAEVGSACDPTKSCNINKDSGLSTAFTIAHEMGHNLGMQHDGDPSVSCQAEARYLMAPSFAASSNPHHWSHCSRQQLAGYLDSPSSACLDNRPTTYNGFSGSPLLPGMERTPTEQCHLLHGNTSTHCPGMTDECRFLWCRHVDGGGCSHRHSPPAPGTTCTLEQGEAGVCYQGLCIEYNGDVEEVDGGWGEWGEWGACSLTCGTGVQSSQRECDSPVPANGGQYCLGRRQRYRTCNMQECPTPGDVRQQQCERNPPSDQYSKWEVPSFDYLTWRGLDTCKQHCRPQGSTTVFTRMSHLPDGTPCSTGTPGVCVRGECVPVGCDHQLNVTAQRDQCGVWCGDGSSCVRFSGTYRTTEHSGVYRYYKAVTIPGGAANIEVTEVRPSRDSFLAAGTTTESINSGYRILWSGLSDLWFAGTIWWYERPHTSPEYLRTDSVIHDNITIYLLTNKTQEGIQFSFSLPRETASLWTPTGQPVYYWNSTEWEGCDADCGEGGQEREVVCVQLAEDGGRVEMNDSYCDTHARPSVRRACMANAQCLYEWRHTEWSTCSAECGEGVESREVYCLEVSSGETRVNESHCSAGTEPATTQSCQTEPCRYEWHLSEWGGCDAVCGEGRRKREVVCLWMNLWLKNGKEDEAARVSDSYCSNVSQPADSDSCQAEPCNHFQWVATDWTECDVACGEGSQNRSSSCQHRNGTKLQPQFCSWQDRPVASQTCTGHDCTTAPPSIPPPTTAPPSTPPPTTEPSTEPSTPPPTTEPSSPTPSTHPPTTQCANVRSIGFCNLVTRYRLCGYFDTVCCRSCSR